jgi:penicillin-binding protein-related factor A (putative recombinase)
VYEGQAWLVEIKSSNDKARFPLKNISKKQVGHGRYWRTGGAKEIFIIHSIPTNEFFFVPFEFIDKQFREGKSSLKWLQLAPYRREPTYEFYKE